ncbi:MAG: hypothetical protein A2X94_02805 [Bdellovibrionales bacterium GWB1_55_8]|nr:MAG: hypothetical protein A2X94_02805 [Bdellovibrionales bacterium GWB1_55_8]
MLFLEGGYYDTVSQNTGSSATSKRNERIPLRCGGRIFTARRRLLCAPGPRLRHRHHNLPPVQRGPQGDSFFPFRQIFAFRKQL